MAITKEQIFEAADELDAAGHKPTLAAVRKAVGGGSYTTIQDAVTEWKARKAVQDAPLREPTPTGIADKLNELGGAVWTCALELANARLAADREHLATERAETEAARKEAAELADAMTEELDEAKRSNEALQQASTKNQSALDEAGKNLAAAQAVTAALEKQTAAAGIERDAARDAAAKAREEAARLAGQVQALQDQLTALLARMQLAKD